MSRLNEAEVHTYAPYHGGKNLYVLTGEIKDGVVEYWEENGKYHKIPVEEFKRKFPKRGVAKDLDRFDEGIEESVVTVYEDSSSMGVDPNSFVGPTTNRELAGWLSAALKLKYGETYGRRTWQVKSVDNLRYYKAYDSAEWSAIARVDVDGERIDVPLKMSLYSSATEFFLRFSVGNDLRPPFYSEKFNYSKAPTTKTPARYIWDIIRKKVYKEFPKVLEDYMFADRF